MVNITNQFELDDLWENICEGVKSMVASCVQPLWLDRQPSEKGLTEGSWTEWGKTWLRPVGKVWIVPILFQLHIVKDAEEDLGI